MPQQTMPALQERPKETRFRPDLGAMPKPSSFEPAKPAKQKGSGVNPSAKSTGWKREEGWGFKTGPQIAKIQNRQNVSSFQQQYKGYKGDPDKQWSPRENPRMDKPGYGKKIVQQRFDRDYAKQQSKERQIREDPEVNINPRTGKRSAVPLKKFDRSDPIHMRHEAKNVWKQDPSKTVTIGGRKRPSGSYVPRQNPDEVRSRQSAVEKTLAERKARLHKTVALADKPLH